MKSYKNKILMLLCAVAMLSMGACTGDLDLEPNDPNTLTMQKFKENPKEYLTQVMAKCYASLSSAGSGGDGKSDLSGLDANTSQYTREMFMLNEFTTDESKWIWKDKGVVDLVTSTWSTDNINIYGAYARFFVHIAVCNNFLRLVSDGNLSEIGISPDAELKALIDEYKLEARALRAFSYYNIVDMFGNGGFIDESSADGDKPVQKTRAELYAWLTGELESLVTAFPDTTPIYGRVGKDGVEALLARTYLNGKVFANDAEGYKKCSEHCANIIARHQGGGFNGSGLAKHYMYLFCASNDEYMPGGGNTAENEILWGVPYEYPGTQVPGGTLFLIAGSISANVQTVADYGMSANWTCMHTTSQFSDKFTDDDIRCSMWCKEEQGFNKANTGFSTFTDGYGVVKFTNLIKGSDGEWSAENGGKYDPTGTYATRAANYPDTDLPLIRLADVYLMYTEAYAMGGAGDAGKAVQYVNYVRERAGVSAWDAADLTASNILDERGRELYWECTRRTDLVRFGKFTGSAYNWSWKNNTLKGGSIPAHLDLFPIPTNVISAQPEYKQNTGY